LLDNCVRQARHETDGGWIVVPDPASGCGRRPGVGGHPAPPPNWSPAQSRFVEQVRCNRAIVVPAESVVSAAVCDFYDVANVALKESSAFVVRLLENEAMWPNHRAVRILQIGFGPLTSSLLSLNRRRAFDLTVLEPDRRRFEPAQRAVHRHNDFRLLDADAKLETASFDLILAAESLHRLPDCGVLRCGSPAARGLR
jgi:hypothetical protein